MEVDLRFKELKANTAVDVGPRFKELTADNA